VAGNSSDSGRSVTSKIVAILLTFTDGSVHSLTEIARLTGLPTSTVHRLVSELAASGLLERTDEVRYRVGVSLQAIGARTAYTPSMQERARRVMEDLSLATRSDVRLGVLDNCDVQFIEKRAGHQPVSAYSVPNPLPAHASAMGKAILAFSPPSVVARVIARGLPACTPYTVTSPDRLRKTLAVIRLTRLAVSRWELAPGESVVAVPVFCGAGNVVAALELTAHDLRNDLRSIQQVLLVAGRGLSRELATSPGLGRPTRVGAVSLRTQTTAQHRHRASALPPLVAS
jgi:DNA-binding IclR family transcriptional regulator